MASKRRKTVVESDDDVFVGDGAADDDVVEEGKSARPIESFDHVADVLWNR